MYVIKSNSKKSNYSTINFQLLNPFQIIVYIASFQDKQLVFH